MKNQSITVLDTHPVLLNILEPGYTLSEDWPDSVAEMRRILDASPRPLYIVDDIRELKLSIDDLIKAASLVGRGNSPLYKHPNSLGICFISDSKAVEIAAKGMHSPIFENMSVKVFHSLEDALADIEGMGARN